MTKIASMLILNALARVCRHAAVETSGTCTANTLQQEFRDDYFQSLLGAGGQLHVDLTEGQHQKQFGKSFAQNFVDKELNLYAVAPTLLSNVWRSPAQPWALMGCS